MNRHIVRLQADTDRGTPLDHLDEVLDALEDLETTDSRILESDISAHLAEGAVSIELVVDAASALDAVEIGVSTIRTAIHTAGGATPGWERLIRAREVSVDPDDDCIPV